MSNMVTITEERFIELRNDSEWKRLVGDKLNDHVEELNRQICVLTEEAKENNAKADAYDRAKKDCSECTVKRYNEALLEERDNLIGIIYGVESELNSKDATESDILLENIRTIISTKRSKGYR